MSENGRTDRFEEVKGILFCYGLTAPEELRRIDRLREDLCDRKLWCYDNRLHKFPQDEVLFEKEGTTVFFDGYAENKQEIMDMQKAGTWKEGLAKELIQDGAKKLRGGFCGFTFDKEGLRLFVDHVGNRALYYYAKDNVWIVSTRYFYIVELLKYHRIPVTVDENAVRYMLTLAFMADDTTFCSTIKRVCPGCMVTLKEEKSPEIVQYYRIDNTRIDKNMTMEEAVDGVDHFFRQAVRREFDKDREYGYHHLVDLSGGLDSRMTSWVAQDLGYTKQLNLTFCKSGYLDVKIAQQIASDLGHRFLYMPLDDFVWYADIEKNCQLLNGASLYCGSTGTRPLLELLNGREYGIEHTGMVGDAIIGSFYADEAYNYAKPEGSENAYSHMLSYELPAEVLDSYENREQFSVYVRGLLGAESSYLLRQNYFEMGSPFLDPDFLDFIFQIPLRYRRRHTLYLKWMETKYPDSTCYGWEKWYGLRPRESSRSRKKLYELKRRISVFAEKSGLADPKRGMNPLDYWYGNHPQIVREVESYYQTGEAFLEDWVGKDLAQSIRRVFTEGNASEKAQALTVIAMLRMMLE